MSEDTPPPEDYSEKETYAFFGLAAYFAQVLEKGLVNMVVAFKTCGMPITRDQFDAVFETYDAKTIGQLLRAAADHQIPIPEAIQLLLKDALRQRNYLNHDFFADHAGHFMTEQGRRTMIERLSGLIRVFRAADRAIEPVYKPLLQRMGVTDATIQREIQQIIAAGELDRNG